MTERANCGSFVSMNSKYVFAFGGFNFPAGSQQKALQSVERLALRSKASQWEELNFSPSIKAKACFYLYQIDFEAAGISNVDGNGNDVGTQVMLFGGWRDMMLQKEVDVWDYKNNAVTSFYGDLGQESQLINPDMITKRPIQIKERVWFLGRRHIHWLNLKTKKFG